MKYKCPYCNGEVKPDDIMFRTCPHCKKVIDRTTVKEEYGTSYTSSNNKENSIERNGYERTDAGKVREVKGGQKVRYAVMILLILLILLSPVIGVINYLLTPIVGPVTGPETESETEDYIEPYKKGFIWGKISGEKDRNRGTDWLNPYSPHPITGVGTMEQYLAEQAGYTYGTSEYGDFLKGYEDGYYSSR